MEKETDNSVKIKLLSQGPLIIKGQFELIGSDGNVFLLSADQIKTGVALCRCGKSQNMPFCDGAHLK